MDRKLIRIIEPETAVDKAATEQLTMALTDIITSGVLDPLAKTDKSHFAALSWSRLGGYGDQGVARMIFDELKRRNLARDSEDGVSVPLHPLIHSLVLVLLAQILRPHGRNEGLNLSPATDRPQLVGALRDILGLKAAPSAGHVIAADLQAVGVDLTTVPLAEVLSFRQENLAQHRKYALDMHRFVRDISLLPLAEREREMEVRTAEINEAAKSLRSLSTRAWKRTAAFFSEHRRGRMDGPRKPLGCGAGSRRSNPRLPNHV